MKKFNFTNFVLCLLTLVAFQAQAQYSGVAYQGNTPQVGVTVGTPVTIEFEYFDALSSDPNGDGANFNDNTNGIPGAGGTYNDKSFGGTANGNSLRTTGDVDIEANATGNVVRDVQNAEYTIYTINVVTAGTYHMNVNYAHSGSGKRFQFYNHAADGTGQTLLYDSQDGGPVSPGTSLIPSTAGIFATSEDSEQFFLPAGTSLIRFRHLSAGPSFDFFTLTLDAVAAAPNEYHGVAYQNNIPQLGANVGVADTIEFEHYDALDTDPSGDGANYNDPVDSISGTMMGTYYDDSPGGHSNGNTARATSDIDIKAGGSGDVVTDVKPNEYTIYTVNVLTPGRYYMGVNYAHGGTSKDIKVYSHKASDGSEKTLLYDSNPDGGLPATGNSSTYATTDSLGFFDLEAGPLLLRIRTLDPGPSFDFFTITLDSSYQLPAQYDGVAYQNNIPQLGTTPGETVQIEFENYDALNTDPNGDGGNFNDSNDNIPTTGMGTYYDDSPGGHVDGNTARATSDVDIKADGSGNVVTDVKPNEYTVYTVNVVNAGTYYLGMNYKHAGTSKDIKVYSHNPDGSGKTLLYDSNPTGGLPQSDYVTENNIGSFDLPAGPLLIRVRHLDAGSSYDYFTLTYQFPVNTEDKKLEENALKVFPNPASDGLFNIDINTEEVWEVYSLTGSKVLGGIGNQVDLSTFPKGVYILRTQNKSMKLMSF